MTTRTLTARIARAMAFATALASASTALVADTLTTRWTLAREDARLTAAAETLYAELTGDPSHDAHEADDELRELAPASVRIALWNRGIVQGGDRALVPTEGCVTAGSRRVCTVSRDARAVVTASSMDPLRATRRVQLGASLVAVLTAVLAAAMASRRVSGALVAPLTRLRAAMETVRAEHPERASLGGDEGWDEVDALRASLADLLRRHGVALAQSRRFAADAAHELRTPLATMRAELELASEADAPPEVQAALTRVRATLARVSALSERLLILAAPLDEARVGREAVSLAEVARECAGSLDGARRARVTVEADDEVTVRGDAALLRVLIDNGVENALKFSTGAVTVRVGAEGERAVLRVCDEGAGVPEGERARVFEAFHRSAEARAGGVRGHGVGLALVAHIARAHGGAVCFENVARGAVLRVTLPVWA